MVEPTSSHALALAAGNAFPAQLHLMEAVPDTGFMRHRVRKAVFPAAGLGTRFLPATKAQPKEMLPLVDKPLIQYGIEETQASGIDNVIVVTGRGKHAIEDHFDKSFELEHELDERGKKDALAQVQSISDLARISYIRQREPLGLGHAVSVASELVGDEPFAVVLADDVIKSQTPALEQLLNIHEYFGAAVFAVMQVPKERISKYGVIAGSAVEFSGSSDRLFRVTDLVEKPAAADAPSDLAIIGRYILPGSIFQHIADTEPGAGGEIQLTDAIHRLIEEGPVYAYRFEGKRYDAGNKLEYLQAGIDFALDRPDLGPGLRDHLKSLDLGGE